MRRPSPTLFTLLCALAAGCTDFDLPSALTREQIVAVRSAPASLTPGGRARLDALVAGPDGIIDGDEAALAWSLTDPSSSSGAAIEIDEDGSAWLSAAAGAEPGPVGITLAVTAPSGSELRAVKEVAVGEEASDNPGPMGVVADGEPVADELRAAPGAAVSLMAELDGVESPQLSWYATVGEIELYRRNPTELITPQEPDQGWLIAVVRDGAGGVTWQVSSVVVE